MNIDQAAARIAELEAALSAATDELEMLKADFNDCNSERARHKAAREAAEAEAARLREALRYGAQLELPEMLEWVADRFVHVYGESPNVDFVLTLRERAKRLRAALGGEHG